MRKNLMWKSAAVVGIAGIAGMVAWLSAATSFTPGNAPTGNMGQLEVTNFNLSSGNEIVFKTDFEKQYFTGNVFAYPVGADGVINTAAEIFDGGAKTHLDAQDFDTGRIIVTMNASGAGTEFRWSSISGSQQTDITASTVLDYVRGDRSNETVGLGYRARNSTLGTIIHSRPFYLPNSGSPVLFVGANDGMLHAFNASTGVAGGDELWAYVPSMLMSNLPLLKADPFVHTYFVDGGLNVADAVIGGATKKVLVSGLGAGGKGLFALDVTNPIPANEAAAKAKVLWEITPSAIKNSPNTDYANLGYTYGTPVITKVNSGSGQSAVIMGNGYNATGVSTLYVINISNGALIKAIATTGSASGGLSTPACYDATGADGRVDFCYAGDIDGKLWKFNLSDTAAANWSASLVYTTSPAQAITMAPSISTHPSGGVMVNFATGKMFVTGDVTDNAVHYAYGVWDGAPVANAATLTQTLTEKSYTSSGVTTRVRRVTSNVPNWASGASNHKGWKVALPAGERVVGDTVFTESGRFYFNAYNPNIDNSALTPPTPNGENWLMELDYLTGGTVNSPFLDLNGDQLLTNADRIVYTAFDTLPPGTVAGDPILTTDGIAVGKFISNGVSSHPILVQLATLNTTLLNQNPDVFIPTTPTERGVAGGHFDVDIFYGPPPTTICSYDDPVTGSRASATITVTTTGNARPAALGGITVNGVELTGPLGPTDFPNGTQTSTNATKIFNKINAMTSSTGFSATVNGSVVTVKAPAGTAFNTKPFVLTAGASSAGSAASGNGTGSFQITNAQQNRSFGPVTCGGTNTMTTTSTSNNGSLTRSQYVNSLATNLNNMTAAANNGYKYTCSMSSGGNTSNPPTTPSTCTVTGPTGAAACSQLNVTKSGSISLSNNSPSFSGGAAGVAGQDDLSVKLTLGGAFSGGTPTTPGPFDSCQEKTHFHEYDNIYNVTGVNMLNASSTTLNLERAIPKTDTTTAFKLLVHNQYLNPGVTVSVGGAAHTSVKFYNDQTKETSAANVIANAPAYTWANILTLEYNMPLDIFSAKDWWTLAGGTGFAAGSTRAGLLPTYPYCAIRANYQSSNSGNTLFNAVVPPANNVTTKGTISSTATGAVRHNGALSFQLIKAATPASAIELQDAARPEYGWRVKAADYETYTIAEWVTYWHHPNDKCFHSSGWSTSPALDLSQSDQSKWKPIAAGSDDPSSGSFRATSAIASVATTVSGNVTTTVTTYTDGKKLTVVKTANADGTTTISTTIPDGTTTTVTVANTTGKITTGGDEKGSQAKTGRISWSERLRN